MYCHGPNLILPVVKTDNLLSGTRCNTPFSKPECKELMKVLRDMQGPCNANSPGKIVFLAWFLREVCSYRNAESYGLHTRTSISPRSTQEERQDARSVAPHLTLILYLITNLLFFGIPWSYLSHVKASFKYHGRFISLQESWEAYVQRLVREYSHFLLVSTVLLSATVGVLTMPEITSGSRAAAIVSAFFALGSVIVSVFSIWRHQANMLPSAVFTYIRNANRHILGLQGHAMLLSVPPVLLVWAIITFTLSIAIYTIQGVDDRDSLNRIVTWVALTAFVVILGTVIVTLHNTFSLVWHIKMSLGRSVGSILRKCIRCWQTRRSGTVSVIKDAP
ncbi:hypothetical protein E1B28_004486 [Marasmius oreades]|uniref:Uncharacterized protein n=1 Tax=Marasmius oreades TaxID=181124 RepID=A0A9P7UYM7_9AGAR|nr:uncharacterized protein E1B28_004486 [Marasmius oreades]KAG7097105.1 hypothetical protein E1B28_004486 [Marasmius oreades]